MMGSITRCQKKLLAVENKHVRDDDIKLDEQSNIDGEQSHTYHVLNDPWKYTSVTALVSKYFPVCSEADPIILARATARASSNDWRNRGQHFTEAMTAVDDDAPAADESSNGTNDGCTDAELQQQLHRCIAAFYNNQAPGEPMLVWKEYDMFLDFHNDHCELLVPYRTEWKVFDDASKLAGTISMVRCVMLLDVCCC
jgi:hypothetical protein